MEQQQRLSFWGVGPRVFAAGLFFGLAAELAGVLWPGVFGLPVLTTLPWRIAAALVTAAGVVGWLACVAITKRAYRQDVLATSGVFAICRNPIYACWILLLAPGLALLSGMWSTLLTPLVMAAVFRACIGVEERYLEHRFGESYREYRARVPVLVPFIRPAGLRAGRRTRARRGNNK